MSRPAIAEPRTEERPDLGAVYRTHAQTVARWAARLAGPTLEVEDVVQEVFLTVQRLLPTFRGDAKITTWIYRITENVVRHRRRKERMRRWLGRGEDELDRLRATGPTPVEELERRQASARVYRVLDAMADKYRQAIVLFELEEMSGEEIAELTGLKLATVWVRLHRARSLFVKGMQRMEAAERA